jgi:D-glycero-alpha-D-manno-heptose-7-phosphate kinase
MNLASGIVRTSAPVRLDFAGAWTDVAPFATTERGVVINAAIDLRSHVALRLNQRRYELWARDLDEKAEAGTLEQLARDGRLELLKAAIRFGNLAPCQLHTSAEAPPGSGLGTSGALGVALVHAMDTALGTVRPAPATAEAAWRLETVGAAVAGGKQDQFAAAMGGFQHLVFDRGRTSARSLAVDQEFADVLAQHTLVCYTGRSRFSGDVITRVMQAYIDGDTKVAGALRALADVGEAMAAAFQRGDLSGIGHLLGANWAEQQQLDGGMCTVEMARLEVAMRDAGAVGGKAAGAGAGGSMFFVVPGDMSRAMGAAEKGGATLIPVRWAARGVSLDQVAPGRG